VEVEQKSIEFIPENMRHGSVKSLFTIWFGANMQIIAVITGAVAYSVGLNIAWSILAILLGNIFGAIFVAYHSAQGPKLGIPQMIQSRAQFGVMGAILPLIVILFMYIGYIATTTIVGAQVFQNHLGMSPLAANTLCNFITLVVCVYGYDLIHWTEKYFSLAAGVIFIAVTAMVLQLPVPAGSFVFGQVNFGVFFLAVSIIAAFQISWAPYVADYSRYLPKDTSVASTFGYTYLGLVVACCWMHILGAFLMASIPGFFDDSTQAIAKLFSSPMAGIVLIIIVLGVITVNALNLYGAFMSFVTTVEPFTRIRVSRRTRVTVMTVLTIVCTAISVWGSSDFMTLYLNFLGVLLYLMIPWTAINLVDFYFVRHGEYDIDAIFEPGGKYGRFSVKALTTYFLTFAVEIPFMNCAFYQGSISKAFGGADIASIVGLLFASVVYYVWSTSSASNKTAVEKA
jgi:nucleobase:cation symporter-1, NCS1 family